MLLKYFRVQASRLMLRLAAYCLGKVDWFDSGENARYFYMILTGSVEVRYWTDPLAVPSHSLS